MIENVRLQKVAYENPGSLHFQIVPTTSHVTGPNAQLMRSNMVIASGQNSQQQQQHHHITVAAATQQQNAPPPLTLNQLNQRQHVPKQMTNQIRHQQAIVNGQNLVNVSNNVGNTSTVVNDVNNEQTPIANNNGNHQANVESMDDGSGGHLSSNVNNYRNRINVVGMVEGNNGTSSGTNNTNKSANTSGNGNIGNANNVDNSLNGSNNLNSNATPSQLALNLSQVRCFVVIVVYALKFSIY